MFYHGTTTQIQQLKIIENCSEINTKCKENVTKLLFPAQEPI